MSGLPEPKRPGVLARAAVEVLATQFFEPLGVADLLHDAWVGGAAALLRAGGPFAPSPIYPDDPCAAYLLHDKSFPTLERLSDGHLSGDELVTAALEHLLDRRHDVHTLLAPRGRFWGFEADPTSAAGWSSRTFGMVLTDTPPLTVVDLLPQGPAQLAGLRRGQAVLAINGQPTAHLRRVQATARLDWQHQATNVLTVRAPGQDSIDLELQSDLVPMPCTKLLPGRIGLLRMDGFTSSATESEALRAALMEFEQAGALGWIIDMRWNGGGPSVQLSRLLIDQGRLFSRLRHNEVHLVDGTVLPMRQDIDLDGTALPFQRPLVILFGPGSVSGAESFAGPMQAYGRATLVGERTAGACGVVRSVTLAPDWSIAVATHHTDFGPNQWRLNRIGVTPDVHLAPAPEDEATGRDPQLEIALEILRAQTTTS